MRVNQGNQPFDEINVCFWQEQRAILLSQKSKEVSEKIRALRIRNQEADKNQIIEANDMAPLRAKV